VITTLVTSTAVLCLVAEGALGLDDPANRHLRGLRLADDTITVRQLLAHTAGVDSPPLPSLWGDSAAEPADVLGPVAGCSGPRGEFAFSPGGYAVLGQLIADLTGTSFAQAATRLVLQPLGMAGSSFPARTPVSPALSAKDLTHGYRLTHEGSFEPEPLPVLAFQSAGGLWSTGPDLVRFGSGWKTLLPGNSPSKRCARTPSSTTQRPISGSAGCCGARWTPPATPAAGAVRRPR
jgi:CubicO group peptidase (beta-lactamase class C family)